MGVDVTDDFSSALPIRGSSAATNSNTQQRSTLTTYSKIDASSVLKGFNCTKHIE
jgi:hypothetical protein